MHFKAPTILVINFERVKYLFQVAAFIISSDWLRSSVGLQLAGTSILVSDLSKVATQERTLMEQSRELLSTLATMHVSIQSSRLLFWPYVYL